jgi:lipopolysaccharide transport system ATP-binding protein
MKSLTQTGRTILFVSHQKESIIKLCNHAILLDKGKIIQKSETMNVMQTYEKIAGSNAFSATNMGGHKEIVISEIRVKNLGKKDASKILPSSGIEILTTIESRSKFNIKDCELAISVVSSKGEKVFSISNVMQNQVFTTKYISQAKIICSITQPKLNPGNYSLNVVIKHLGELQDWIANTGGFTISWEDFYHSGIMPVNEEYVLAEAKWNYQKQE